MAEKTNPFGRSKKIVRSPPQTVTASSMSESLVADTSKQSCQLCQDFDNVDMVECSECTRWFHFVCVGVKRDIESKDWWCNKCSIKRSNKRSSEENEVDRKSTKSSRSTRTLTSRASSATKRRALALERIEEEKALREAREKEYLDKKYKTLEEGISSDEDDDPEDSDDVNLSENTKKYTSQWVDDQIGRANETGDEVNQKETPDDHKMLTSTESSIRFSSEKQPSESWLRNKYQVEALDKRIENLRFEKTRRDAQVLIAPTQTSNFDSPSSDLVNLNEEAQVDVVQINNHSLAPINQSTAAGQMNIGVVSKPRGRESTYSVFTKQVPIISSSVIRDETINQVSTFGRQTHFTHSNSVQTSSIATSDVVSSSNQGNQSTSSVAVMNQNPTGNLNNHWQNAAFTQQTSTLCSQPADPEQQILISLNGGKPSSSIVIPRQSVQNTTRFGGQPNPIFTSGQSNLNPSFIGGQSTFTSGQSNLNPSFIGGQSTFTSGQSNLNPNFTGGPSISSFTGSQPNPIFTSGQSNLNPSFIGGQSNLNPSFIGGQSNLNPSFIGGQSNLNPSFIGGQSNLNPNFVGGQSNPSFIGGLPNQSNIGNSTLASRTFGRLEANQIAARQAMPKSLPKFDGTPKDWLIFISAYENANDACGYSNSENLGRLTDCLVGDAKTAVHSMLLHPDSVPQIIQTLQLLYGRPELIIGSLLDELQNEPSPKENDLAALVRYAMKVKNLVETIRKLGPLDHLSNPVMLKILVDKLPTQTRMNWAYHKFNNPRTNLASFGDWLYGLAQVTSQMLGPGKLDSAKKDRKEDRKDNNITKKLKASQLNVHVDNNPTKRQTELKPDSQNPKQCPICSMDTCKQMQECSIFRSLKPSERWNLIKEKKLCYSCFGKHRQFKCRSRKKCQVDGCQSTHHILLHDSERQGSTAGQTNSSSSTSKITKEAEKKTISSEISSGVASKSCNSIQVRQRSAKFRIVPVVLYANKKAIKTFAYYDDGSDLSLIERGLAKELGLTGIPDYLNVRWAFKNTEEEADSEIVSLRISGDFQCAEDFKIDNVFTVDELFLPAQSITRKWLDSYKHLKELPIATYEDATPRLLIGLHCSKLMVSHNTVEGKWTEPIACRTRLGWVIQGPDDNDDSEQVSNTRVSLNIYECHNDNQLHNLVKEFFSFESLGTQISQNMLESRDTIRARKIMESTTVKKNGRFETGLLWRNDDVHLPDSYAMALNRLNCLEKKMQKDPNLAKKLSDQIEDFVGKKYIRKLLPHEVTRVGPRTWYLPIFVVFNPKKPLKVRTVWDAAAKVKNVSLNSVLLKGPDQLVPLPDVLRRFRERLYGITGDIGEMYHRIGVIEKDRCAQRFLWRDGQSIRKPDVYEMEVLTFGSSCSPSSAQFVKNRNALEYKDRFPRAVEAIIDNTYIDDMLDCAHTIDEAVCLAKNAKFIHQQASFELGKFVSNSSEVLQSLGANDTSQIKNLNLSLDTTTERVLGMFWNTCTDMFTFSLKYAKIDEMVMTGNRKPTKREVLRALMSIFDPLGLIANVLVYAKILLQRIWRKSTDWDEQITESLQEDWLTWIQFLPQVETLEIPRLYSPKLSPKSPKSIQIHIFVDASIEACAAVTYFRFEDELGVDCALVGAKTKVAPNKPMTVPRLELQAAVLGTRLASSIGNSQRLKFDKRYFWSDSQTVLSWITSETRKYNQFVAFRVGEILESSVEDEWNWISTKDNVADEATKSKNKLEISSTSRWFKGPLFLYQPENQWNRVADKSQFNTDEELRPRYLLAQFVNKCKKVIEPNNFSNWQKLRRTLAFVLRFIDNLKLGKKNRLTGPLLREEYIRAENKLYQQTQNDKFTDEIAIIRHNSISPIDKRKDFDKASILRTCSPYIDEFGVLRIKGRLDAAKHLAHQTKRPIILPRDHRITKLIVNDYHRKYHHLNHQTTLNELHQKYFIPSMRRALKDVIHNICQRCKNDRASPKVPEMADLPPARVATFTLPYTYTGVDYFGPFTVKVNTTKRKRWGVLFTCLTTRAIHIEVAEALTTNECILAVTRFTGRRGTPAEFYSDNGTNFHGSERELREEFAKLDFAKIEATFTNEISQWRFNPPAAPHMGGSWERMIRTVKALLKKTMPTRTPTVKMFETYLIEVEYIINSRPLTYVHLDHLEDEVLTPNHFLLGSSGGVRNPGKFDETCLLRDDWKAVQHLTDLFWRRFNIEYLPTLTRRTKWFKDVKPIEVGDLVIIVDHKHPRNTWPKGIVEEIFPGRGKRVRQAKIRLVKGRDNLSKINVKNIKHQSLVRPVAKLAVLDVRKNELSSSPEAVNGRENVANAPESHITESVANAPESHITDLLE